MKTLILAVLILAVLLVNESLAQENNPDGSNYGVNMFSFDALDFYSPDSTRSRLDIYIEVPLNKVEFTRAKDENIGFIAKLQLSIDITDMNKNTVFSRVYKEDITTQKTETEYLSKNSKIIIKNIYLHPGNYKLKVSMYEPSTKRSASASKDIVIRDFTSKPLAISDIMIVSKLDYENGRKFITPDITRNVSILDTFYVFFFVYKNSEESQLNVTCSILDSKKNEVYLTSKSLDPSNGLDVENQFLFPVPVDKLSYDNYTIQVTAATPREKVEATGGFSSIIQDFPVNLNDIDELISQLQYIATPDEMSHMRDGKTDSEKRKRFMDFWKSKDPTPLSRKNEVMLEYYRRLKYADKNYSTVYSKGWKSDRGMVYIIFGKPDNIDSHPYEMDTKPYEVWDYYQLNRQFVFVDYSGFGDYRLITPIYETFKFK
jgi:GWxTD domain-containing protein